MALQTSQPQNIRSIYGNGLSVFLDSGNNLYLKDSRGSINLLSVYIPSSGITNINAGNFINTSGTGTEADPLVINAVVTGLEEIDEGNGIGRRLIGTPAANVGNIGFHAIDMGEYFAPSTTQGALGTHSFIGNGDSNTIESGNNTYGAFTLGGGANIIRNGGTAVTQGSGALGNFNEIISGYTSMAFGAYHIINNSESAGGFGFAMGTSNNVNNFGGGALGMTLDSTGRNHIAVGVSNTIYAGSISATSRPIFTVGNGTHTTPTGKWTAVTRSDAMIVQYDGLILAPSLTNSLIDVSGTGKELTSVEWVLANSTNTSEWANYTGTKSGMDLVVTLGDFDSEGNGTRIIINDGTQTVSFNTVAISIDENTTVTLGATSNILNTGGSLDIVDTASLPINIGDLNSTYNSSLVQIDDTNQLILLRGTSGINITSVVSTNYANLKTTNLTAQRNFEFPNSAGTLYTRENISTGYTVAGLPAATVGDRAYVTDATAATFGAAPTGGGGITVPVFYDGAAWIMA